MTRAEIHERMLEKILSAITAAGASGIQTNDLVGATGISARTLRYAILELTKARKVSMVRAGARRSERWYVARELAVEAKALKKREAKAAKKQARLDKKQG